MAKDRAQNAMEQPTPSLDLAARHADAFGKAVGRSAYEYRHELGLLAIPVGACAGLIVGLRQNPVSVVVAAAAVLVAARRTVGRVLAAARIRRRWDRAAAHCKLPGRAHILKVERTWSGSRLRMRVSHGLSFDLLASRTEALRASMCVAEVKVKRDPKDASRGSLTLISRDPLLEQAGKDWPALTRDKDPSLWDAFPIGIDEHGDQVSISLVQKHLLVGGITGAGKSIMLSMPLAIAALDPTVRVFLLDAKGGVEFAPWARCAERFAMNIQEGIETLTLVKGIMHQRLDEMRERGIEEGSVVRGISRESGWPMMFVAIDELARFTDHGDKKLRDEFNALLDELIALGRSPGLAFACGTQKPEGSVLPTRIRDQFPYRMALRCSTPEASDTILGRGWAAQGFNAQKISEQEKGVGYLLSEDGSPIRLRTFFLSDEDVVALAERAWQLRQGQSHRGRPLRSVA